MSYQLRPMTLADHSALLSLMEQTPGVVVRDADNLDATARYLLRNPGLSMVAEQGGHIVGCLMAGHDGRRGYLQHLLVLPAHRGQGLARQLVERVLAALAREGIDKSHLDVLVDNHGAIAFWQHLGWQQRDDLLRYSFIRSGNPQA